MPAEQQCIPPHACRRGLPAPVLVIRRGEQTYVVRDIGLRSGEVGDAMKNVSQRDRRRELIPCAVMVFLVLLIGGACSTLLNSCRSGRMCVGPGAGLGLVLFGTI